MTARFVICSVAILAAFALGLPKATAQNRTGTTQGQQQAAGGAGGFGAAAGGGTQGFGAGAAAGGLQGGAGLGVGQGGLQQGGLQQGLNTQTFQPGAFIGNSAQTMQNAFQNQNGQRRAAGLDFSIQNLNELNNSRQQNLQQQKAPVRVQLRPTYLLPASSRALSTAQLQSQVAENLGERLQNGVELSFSGNLVTLAGTVSSDFERDVAAKMLSLQPGVEEVENRLATTEEEAAE